MEQFLIIAPLLAMMEVSFSFDNAVVNASVLRKMDAYWQKAFLTFGMLISVILVRLLLPAIIVSFSSGLFFADIIDMAINKPDEYAKQVNGAHDNILAFGGTFLVLIFLSFLMEEKEDYWWGWIEKPFSWFFRGSEAVEKFLVALLITGIVTYGTSAPLMPCVIAMLVFMGMNLIKEIISSDKEVFTNGFAAFIYLEILDASFSLDGVIGAFSISNNILIIMIGLGIGSLTIRCLTVYMVRKKALEAFKYLEHGAHYSIGALGGLMFFNLNHSVPQVITGLVGITFILMAVISSEVEYHRDNA